MSGWEREITERLKGGGSPDFSDVPGDVMRWLYAFNQCYDNTKNLFVSTRYATVMRDAMCMDTNFNQQFDVYVNSLLSEKRSGGVCCVCYGDEDMMETKCNHDICLGCAKEWLYRSVSCPVCRTIL